MPARITVYCGQADVRVDPEALLREIRDADLATLAEHLDLTEGEDAAVEAIWPHLRVERAGATVEIHWKPDGRPIQLDVVHGDEARGYVAELLDEVLPAADGAGAELVGDHLRETRSIVFLQMGVSDSNHLGAPIGEVVAFRLAETGDGLVWFYHRDRASPDDRGGTIWTTR